MSKNPIVIEEGALAVEAVALMNDKKITNLFVVKDKNNIDNLEVIGILHIHDCLRAKIF